LCLEGRTSPRAGGTTRQIRRQISLLGRLSESSLSVRIMSALDVQNLFGVKGRVALVTGGCSGIGFMIAKVRHAKTRYN